MTRAILPAGTPEIRVALGFANGRGVALGNLGFLIVSRIIGAIRGIRLERFYLPDSGLPLRPGSVLTEPSGSSLPSADLVLFSLSYEGDAPHVPALLEAGGLPAFSAERRPGHPLVVGGGALVMINPEPLASFFDLFLVGEGEVLIEAFLVRWARLRGEGREAMLAGLDELDGALAPARRRHWVWSVGEEGLYADRNLALPGSRARSQPRDAADGDTGLGSMVDLSADLADADAPVETVKWTGIRSEASASRLSAETPLGPAYLLELARGCPRRCRFCAPSRIYAPLRECPAGVILEKARSDLGAGETAGLLSLSAGDYTQLEQLTAALLGIGVRLSISSLPPAFSRERVLSDLVRSGATTLTVAPETGTDRLRAIAGKPITNGAILRSVEMLGRAGLRQLRTYFIMGLPFEEECDIEAIGDLLAQMRRSLPVRCRLSATVNAFVPKPRTPFQWAPMAPERLLRERARHLRKAVPRGVKLRIKSFRQARLQALLSRGDVSWGPRLAAMASGAVAPGAALRKEGLRIEALTGPIRAGSPLPWGYLVRDGEHRDLERDWREVRR